MVVLRAKGEGRENKKSSMFKKKIISSKYIIFTNSGNPFQTLFS